jgi:hypothetical protein
MTSKIVDAAKDVVIQHVEATEGEVLKLVHFAGKKFEIAENYVVALIKREAHEVLSAGDRVVHYGEEKFHIAEDAVLAFLRLHGGSEVKDEVPQPEPASSPAIPSEIVTDPAVVTTVTATAANPVHVESGDPAAITTTTFSAEPAQSDPNPEPGAEPNADPGQAAL